MNLKNYFLLIFAFIATTNTSNAQLSVKATLPELDWLIEQIGGPLVLSSSLLSGHEDPHFVDVTPSFIFKVKNIDLLVKNGKALESTWLPKIIELSGNSNFEKDGLCDASKYIKGLGIHTEIDRSMGDVHPEGNPHYTYSPIQMKLAAKAIAECLVKVDAKNAATYHKNYSYLETKLEKISVNLKNVVSPLIGKTFMTYHEEFAYLCQDYGLKCVGTVEETPGVLPSANTLVKKVMMAKKQKVFKVIATDSNPHRILKKFEEMAGVPFVQIEAHMNTNVKTYEAFISQFGKLINK